MTIRPRFLLAALAVPSAALLAAFAISSSGPAAAAPTANGLEEGLWSISAAPFSREVGDAVRYWSQVEIAADHGDIIIGAEVTSVGIRGLQLPQIAAQLPEMTWSAETAGTVECSYAFTVKDGGFSEFVRFGGSADVCPDQPDLSLAPAEAGGLAVTFNGPTLVLDLTLPFDTKPVPESEMAVLPAGLELEGVTIGMSRMAVDAVLESRGYAPEARVIARDSWQAEVVTYRSTGEDDDRMVIGFGSVPDDADDLEMAHAQAPAVAITLFPDRERYVTREWVDRMVANFGMPLPSHGDHFFYDRDGNLLPNDGSLEEGRAMRGMDGGVYRVWSESCERLHPYYKAALWFDGTEEFFNTQLFGVHHRCGAVARIAEFDAAISHPDEITAEYWRRKRIAVPASVRAILDASS